MDPLLDEKFVLTIARIIPSYLKENISVEARLEAYGPSKNEGFCYETCNLVAIHGEINGKIVVGMDGYTKLKLFPYIAKKYKIDPTIRQHSSSIIMEFANQIGAELINEMQLGRFDLHLSPPENLDHKLVPVDLELNRQYMIIWFLKDSIAKEYLGRLYVILIIKKF